MIQDEVNRTEFEIRKNNSHLELQSKLSKLFDGVLNARIDAFTKKIDEVLYGESHTSISDIIGEVCSHYMISPEDIVSPRRFRTVVEPRQVAWWIIRHNAATKKLSLEKIGRVFGNKDHATVLYGVKQVNNMIEFDQDFRENLMIIMGRLGITATWNGTKLLITKYETIKQKSKANHAPVS